MDTSLANLIEPTPFIYEEFSSVFLREILKNQFDEDFIKDYLKKYASDVEKKFLSFSQIYEKLLRKIKNEEDRLTAQNNYFRMIPLSGDDKSYDTALGENVAIDTLPEEQLHVFITEKKSEFTSEICAPLLERVMNTNLPRTKLAAMQFFLENDFDFQLPKIPQITDQFQIFKDIPQEKWFENNTIDELLKASKSHSLYILQENKKGMILYSTEEELYIFDLENGQVITKNKQFPISQIYENELINICVINNQLTFIGNNHSLLTITKFKDTKVPKSLNLGNSIVTNIDYGVDNTFCIINDTNMYVQSSNLKNYHIDLNDMAIYNDEIPFFTSFPINFSDQYCFRVLYKSNNIYVDKFQISNLCRYIPLIRPSYFSTSKTAAAIIANDMIDSITKVFETIINGLNTSNDYASTPMQNIEDAFATYQKLHHDFNIKKGIFYDTLLIRFILLNVRQHIAKGEKVNSKTKKILNIIITRSLPTIIHSNTLDMVVRTFRYGIYWPKFAKMISKDYISTKPDEIFNLHQSLFFEFTTEYSEFMDRNEQIAFISQRLDDIYTLSKNANNFVYDEEFVPLIQSIFTVINENVDNEDIKAARRISKKLLKVLSILPIGYNLADLILKAFLDTDSKYFIDLTSLLSERKFKAINTFFSSSSPADVDSVSLHTTIFSPSNNFIDIDSELNTPFDEITVTNRKYNKNNIPDNSYINFEEISTTKSKLIDGQILNLNIVGSYNDAQYDLDGIKCSVNATEDFYPQNYTAEDVVYSLVSYLIMRCLNKLMEPISETEFETENPELMKMIQEKNTLEGNLSSEALNIHDDLLKLCRVKTFEKDSIQWNLTLCLLPKQFRNKPRRGVNPKYEKLIFKILIAILWSANYMDELKAICSQQINPLSPPAVIEELSKNQDFKTLINNVRQGLQPLNPLKVDPKEIPQMIKQICTIIMDKTIEKNKDKRKEKIDFIINCFNINLLKEDILHAKWLNAKRIELPKISLDYLNKFFDYDELKQNFISLYRAFIQIYNPNDENFLMTAANNAKRIDDDGVIQLHRIQMVNDNTSLKYIGKMLYKMESSCYLFKRVCGVTFALSPVSTRELEQVKTYTMVPTMTEMLNTTSKTSMSGGYYHLIPLYVNKLRRELSTAQILDLIDPNKELQPALTAMILFGAEIYDSLVTRFIAVNNRNISSNDKNMTMEMRKSYPAVFEVPAPKIPFSKDLAEKLGAFVDKYLNMNTNDRKQAITNCIIVSFVSRVFNVCDNPTELSLHFRKFMDMYDVVTKANVPALTNNQFSYNIRELVYIRKADNNHHQFICLTHNADNIANKKIIFGSPDTASFFAYTNAIQPQKGIRFEIKCISNAIKYIGFIDKDWNPIFISLLDKNIYMEGKRVPYTGSITDISLVNFNDKLLYFGPMCIDTGEKKKRWIFVITVCDDNIINYDEFTSRDILLPVDNYIPHDMDLKSIFPKVMLGMPVSLEGFYDGIIADFSENGYMCLAIHAENDSIMELPVFENMVEPEHAEFESVLLRAAARYKIGSRKETNQKILNLCRDYSISMIKQFLVHFNGSNFIAFISDNISKLTDQASEEDLAKIKKLIGNKPNELLEYIKKQLVEFDNDVTVVKPQDFASLSNNPSGSMQKAYFQSWNHELLMSRTFMNGVHFIFDFKKTCPAFVDKIITAFRLEMPTNLDDALLILKFFNLPNIKKPQINDNTLSDYLNNLVTFIFEKNPDVIVQPQICSELVNKCAKNVIERYCTLQNLLNTSVFPPLALLANDINLRYEKVLHRDINTRYPIQVQLENGSEEYLKPGTYTRNSKRVNKFRYYFDLNGRQTFNDWKEWRSRPIINCIKIVQESIERHTPISTNINFPPIVLFFSHVILSQIKVLPENFYDLPALYRGIESQLVYLTSRGFAPYHDFARQGKFVYLENVPITRTVAKGCPYNQAIVLIDYFAEHQRAFPTTIMKEDGWKRFYLIRYKEENGIDAGGLFRDSLTMMVDELHDTKLNMFEQPPTSVRNNDGCLIPRLDLTPKRAIAIGALIGCIAATNNPQKFKLPMWLWDFLAIPNATVQELIECSDSGYVSRLASVVGNIKHGFNMVINPTIASTITGRQLKLLTIGNEAAITYEKFVSFVEGYDPVVNVFKNAISSFTSEQFELLLKFITGSPTPPHGRERIKVRQIGRAYGDQHKFPLPVAHTCFKSIEIHPYTDVNIFREKLIFAISNVSTMEDN